MTTKSKQKFIDFFSAFDRFIQESKSGKRLQPNGKRISKGTIENYYYTCKLVRKYCETTKTDLRIRPVRGLRESEIKAEAKYWKRFYQDFTNYLYTDCGFFDNYVGHIIKNLKVFFNYLNKDRLLNIGEYHRHFYVRREEIAIYPLMPEELNYLIYDKVFEGSLSERMKEVKDLFVFGCTVALRISDLNAITKSNLRKAGDHHYLVVRSQKTDTGSLIKLPEYAIAIINKYRKYRKRLLPRFNTASFNFKIKRLLELAGLTQPVQLKRNCRGVSADIMLKGNSNLQPRFCDVASSHTMRRTAITTMLSLGVPEQLVRKISGHSANSKDFHRYVFWSQSCQDEATEKMFENLSTRKYEVEIKY